jgi:hypothetical protein
MVGYEKTADSQEGFSGLVNESESGAVFACRLHRINGFGHSGWSLVDEPAGPGIAVKRGLA